MEQVFSQRMRSILPVIAIAAASVCAQTATQSAAAQSPVPPTHANLLRGEYGRYRANNDLLYYHLDIRVDPVKKTIGGKNSVRFKMLKDDNRIQLELYANLNVDKITMGSNTLKYTRDLNTVYIDFPQTLKADSTNTIDF